MCHPLHGQARGGGGGCCSLASGGSPKWRSLLGTCKNRSQATLLPTPYYAFACFHMKKKKCFKSLTIGGGGDGHSGAMRQMIRPELFLPAPRVWQERRPGAPGPRVLGPALHTLSMPAAHKVGGGPVTRWPKTVATVKWSSGCEGLMIHTWNLRCQAGCLGAWPLLGTCPPPRPGMAEAEGSL